MIKPILLSILLLTVGTYAQVNWAFSGYLTDFPIQQIGLKTEAGTAENLSLNLTRLRLEPVFHFGENTRIKLAYEATSLWQSQTTALLQPSSKNNRQIWQARWQPIHKEKFTLSHFIDRLYIRQDFDFGNIIIGRQRMAWGTGRIWNPIDLFNPINPAVFSKIEKDGADLASAKIYLGDFSDITIVVNPQSKLDSTNGGVRFRSKYKTTDISLISGYFDQRYTVGGAFAGNLKKAGIRGEVLSAHPKTDAESNFIKAILGIDYQFHIAIYALAEYHYNGEGKSETGEYQLERLLNGEIINLGKHYLFLQSLLRLHPLVSASIGNNLNLIDGSGFGVMSFDYSWKENMDLSIGGQFFYGKPETEYWYYPISLFGKVAIYF